MLVLLRERLSLVRLDLPELRTRTSSTTAAAVTQGLSFLYPTFATTSSTTPQKARKSRGAYVCLKCIHSLASASQKATSGKRGAERKDGIGSRRNYPAHDERQKFRPLKQRERDGLEDGRSRKISNSTTRLQVPARPPEQSGGGYQIQSPGSWPPPFPYVNPHGTVYPREIPAISVGEARQVLKARIQTFEEFLYHSDLYTAAKDKLIDDPRWRNSHDLWRTITKFRKRVYGLEGIRHVWRGLRWRDIEIPLHGELGVFWWKEFAIAAGADEAFRREVFAYIEQVGLGVNALWDLFFKIVLEDILFKDPCRNLDWIHNFDNQLDAKRTVGFLAGAMERAVHMPDDRRRTLVYETLRKFYLRWANAKIYEKIIPLVLEHRPIKEAMDWHEFLMRNKDYPPESGVADPIFSHVAEQCPGEEGLQLLRSFVTAGSKIQESTLIIMVKKLRKKRQVLDMLIGRNDRGERARPVIWQPRLTDSFAAIVLSQIDIEPLPAAHYLRALGISTLYTSSLSALLIRTGSRDALSSTLRTLAPIVKPDIPSLTSFNPESIYPPKEQLLRSAILESNHKLALSHLDEYLASPPYIPLHRGTLDLLSIALLNRNAAREEAYLNTHSQYLTFAIKLFLSLHLTGSRIPALTWRECFLHLGWSGRLLDLEALALWLACVYKDDGSMLHRIFTPLLFYAIVEWPFLHFAHRGSVLPLFPPPRPNAVLPAQHTESEAPIEPFLGQRDYTFGLRLARKLREVGIRVDSEVLKRAVRIRLRALYGSRDVGGYSRKLEVRRWNNLEVDEVMAKCEEALGERFLSEDRAKKSQRRSRR
ncbi:hypothetical protein BJ508DRAFT_415156 [Ascobolus immersus RN42]|uniref:Uncharacterized protein n=1 Tax=Ascobolus immersus RN42 TaxID=1160509 RepID=A0A3N4I9T8_ASCIM|nr:hypothetical protein BJ508DRAFT_415156 [Ascobolus immersus RN42]